MAKLAAVLAGLAILAGMGLASGQVYNLKVVSDASPDATDIDSLVRSTTGQWEKPAEKCWALFYWMHKMRRQTNPMLRNGVENCDPVAQFNDFGYAMCSTTSGINANIWGYMGMRSRTWDLAAHTNSEVQYDGQWHAYDSAFTAVYTLCDGVTIAGTNDIGAEGACEASGGKKEAGHIARYHCLNGTSANGWLTGADDIRSLPGMAGVFGKPRRSAPQFVYLPGPADYAGHRYILNLRDGEVYTRYYTRLDGGAEPRRTPDKEHPYKPDRRYFVPNFDVSDATKPAVDPEALNVRYGIRGTGVWTFRPALNAQTLKSHVYSAKNIVAAEPAGIRTDKPGQPAEVVFRISSANVTASQLVLANLSLKEGDSAAMSVSTNNGITWKPVWQSTGAGDVAARAELLDAVSGEYEVLIRVAMTTGAAGQVVLKDIDVRTYTMFNSKMAVQLNLGKNAIHVGSGEHVETIRFSPDLRGEVYKQTVVEAKNIKTEKTGLGWAGVVYQENRDSDSSLTYRMDSPADLKRIRYGALFAFEPQWKPKMRFEHSFDGGKTWAIGYELNAAEYKDSPNQVGMYKACPTPAGTRSVMFRYTFRADTISYMACRIYDVRMEGDYAPASAAIKPIEVTLAWKERQEDYSLVKRSHTQIVEKLPFKYDVNVGGVDHPVMDELTVSLAGSRAATQPAVAIKPGYSDGKDAGGEKFVGRWVTYGKNLAAGKPYTMSLAPTIANNMDKANTTCLTDGVVGAFAVNAGGIGWKNPEVSEVTIDLGKVEACGAFRAAFTCGWPWHDAMKGEVKDRIEVSTSVDGKEFTPRGEFKMNLRKKDLPVNFMLADDESATGWNADLPLDKPVEARYVKFTVRVARLWFYINELQVLDKMTSTPFDLKVSLPQ